MIQSLAFKFAICITVLLTPIASFAGVMMQAFYWDTPAGGVWWDTVREKIPEWSRSGITAIWLPPAQKALSGGFSMGYDPYDYFDLGEFDQKGTTETRHGSKEELISLIQRAHRYGIQVYADITINHNSGGDAEWNPIARTETYTKFEHPHGKFSRSYLDFHPNDYRRNDEATFGGMPDLSHVKPYVQDWLWRRADSVARYYKNEIGFDGWRFDYVKGFAPWVVRDWVSEVGGFAVGELWDGNADNLNNWVSRSGAHAFDFALYYKMRDAFQGGNLNNLVDAGLVSKNPFRAVTFVGNHDVDEIFHNKLLAYAYILTHEGYPTIFYPDYESWLPKDKLNNLLWIHKNLASGSTSNLWVDTETYIAQRNSGRGLVVFLNNTLGYKKRRVQTRWRNTTLKDYTGQIGGTVRTDSQGWVTIEAAGNGYSVWSPSR